MKQAVIFDLDGVLIDSEGIYYLWTEEFFKKNNITLSREKLLSLVGSSERFTQQKIFEWWDSAKHDGKSEKEVNDLYDMYCAEQPFSYADILNPGAKEVLEFIKENGLKTGVASSSPMHAIEKALKEAGVAGFFDAVVSGHMFAESKPDPEVYLYTMRQLGLTGKDCVAVEDSEYGVRAARRAGMTVIGKRNPGFVFDLSDADHEIDDLIEIIEILKRI